jgi:hypothetical protein
MHFVNIIPLQVRLCFNARIPFSQHSIQACDLGSFSWKQGQGMNLTTHLYLVPRLRVSEAVCLLPVYAFVARTATNLPLNIALYEFQGNCICCCSVSSYVFCPASDRHAFRLNTNFGANNTPVGKWPGLWGGWFCFWREISGRRAPCVWQFTLVKEPPAFLPNFWSFVLRCSSERAACLSRCLTCRREAVARQTSAVEHNTEHGLGFHFRPALSRFLSCTDCRFVSTSFP